MSPESFDFAETVSVKQYATDQHPPKSVQWAYQLIADGLPVIRTGKRGGIRIHPPTANQWWLSRMKSRRKPARAS